MVTARGWIVIGVSVGCMLVGRILGIAELFGFAVAGIVLVVLARIYVSRGVGEVSVWAKASPSVAHLGEPARLELRTHNRGATATRTAILRDQPYRGRREPIRIGEVIVPPVPPGEAARIELDLPTVRRGAYELADVAVTSEDPLGLACRRRRSGAEARLVVLPRIEQLGELEPFGELTDNEEASRSTAIRLRTGLSSFRLYEMGDDLRRVHWKTTARVGELMVREGGDPESPQNRSVTVVLDCRRSVHTEASFETAVSAAASVLDTAAVFGSAIRLVTTAGVDSDIGTDAAHLEAVLTELAIADMKESVGHVLGHIGSGRMESAGIIVAVTTTRCNESDVTRLRPLRARSEDVLVLVDAGGGGAPSAALDDPVVRIPAGESVGAAWTATFGAVARQAVAG